MKRFSLMSLALVFALVSCGGGTQYRDASQDKGSREWGPKEIKMTVNKMVTSMHRFLKDDYKKPAFIEVRNFRNKTSEHIDTKMLTDEISTNLIQKRIKFIDQSLTADAVAEMERGMTGMIDPESAIPVGMLKSPNFFLTGDIRDNVRTVGGKSIQYIVVTMQLIDLRTNIVEWQDRQEFLKATSKGKISF